MEDMSRVQEKAKHERQNDDYATANTHQNSSSLNDNAHHIRRRLSQTITSRHCLLIAIALASLSAHACDDTVELQVTCDSGKTTWVVPSHITQTDNTIETNPQMVTVGSCIDGHVKYVARVKGSDIDTNDGIVICPQSDVCYHLKWSSDDQIDVKNCGNDNDNDGDPICRYYCDNGVLKFRNDTNPESTPSDTCFSANDGSHNYECKGNIVRKTPCPNGCTDDHKGCKQDPDLTDKCTADDTLICKGELLFECRKGTYIEVGKACNDKGEVVFCKENELKQEMHTCANDKSDKVVWCKIDESGEYRLHTSACYPNANKLNKDVCNPKQSINTCTQCLPEGNCVEQGTDADQKVSCKKDLTGITSSTGTTDTECKYCYNKDVNNTPTSIGNLGCAGCVPNEYAPKNSTGSTLDPMDEVCYNGELVKFDEAKGSDFILFPQPDSNGLWEFALNVTPAPSIVRPQNPPQQTWQYYNCHNDDAMKLLTANTKIHNANDFLELLKKSNKCCDDENSYYITQTGYRYYSVEKCTNIALQNTNKSASIVTNFSAYAYTPELNGSLIGVEDDLLAKDYACLEAKDKTADTNDVRHMVFVKQKTNGDQQSKDGGLKHGIYKAFECPEKYKCDLKNRYKGLCISENENVPSNSDCSCNNNTIMCGSDIIAACPEGTTPSIVGDSGQSSCDGQIFSLDQIRCVPEGKSTAKQ